MLTSFTWFVERRLPEGADEQRNTYHHGDLKRALTEAALGLVTEKGPKGFTLREVARRAGVSPAAPYRHFSDKAQLVAAVATAGFIQLHEALNAVVAEKSDPIRQTLDMGRAYVALGRRPPRLLPGDVRRRAGQGEQPRSCSRRGARLRDLLDVIVACQQEKLLPAGDPREIAGPTWSLLHGIATLAIGSDLAHVGISEDPRGVDGACPPGTAVRRRTGYGESACATEIRA